MINVSVLINLANYIPNANPALFDSIDSTLVPERIFVETNMIGSSMYATFCNAHIINGYNNFQPK